MSNDIPGLVNLEYVLADIRNRIGIDDRDNERIMQMIISHYMDLNMFYIPIAGNKDVLLNINSINMVDVPGDYVDYIRIGRVVNGRITTLSLNPDLAKTLGWDCGAQTNPYSAITPDLPQYQHYGLGGGYNIGEYVYLPRSRQIEISGTIPGSQIYLEYVSTGISTSGQTWIDRRAVPILRNYVIWKRIEHNDKAPLWEKQRKAEIYRQSVGDLNRAINALTLDEMMDAISQGYRQTPKR